MIIFFDGECNLCNGWVDFLLRQARKKKSAHFAFQFASLQGKTARAIFGTAPMDSIVLYEKVAAGDAMISKESDAVLKIFALLGFPWNLFVVFRLVPSFIRDFFYRIVARNRYSWFGKRDTCRLPTPEEREWLLD